MLTLAFSSNHSLTRLRARPPALRGYTSITARPDCTNAIPSGVQRSHLDPNRDGTG